MTLPDVFVPSNGELVVRDNITPGVSPGPNSYRKERPATMGGYRFGQLSHNSFFTRHNPQPKRVFHMKGLLDAPICTVNDNGVVGNTGYSLNFPPNGHNEDMLKRLPVDAINVNSQLHPINTITGLQYFTGLQSYPFTEKFKPIGGEVPEPEPWRSVLHSLTEACGILPPVETKQEEPTRRPLYSAQTGRLIPPPSRATSRGYSRRSSRQAAERNKFYDSSEKPGILDEAEMESTIMRMLCQILQTEDVNSVKAWLAAAGDAERNMVENLLRSAVAAKNEYYSRKVPHVEYLVDADRIKSATIGISEQSTQTGEVIGAEPQNRLDTATGEQTGAHNVAPTLLPARDGLSSALKLQDKIPEENDIGTLMRTPPPYSWMVAKGDETAKGFASFNKKWQDKIADDLNSSPQYDVFRLKTKLPDIEKLRTPGTANRLRYSRTVAAGPTNGEGPLAPEKATWLQDKSTAR